MEEMLHAYLVCALWSSTDESETPLDTNYTIADIADESLKQAGIDCMLFRVKYAQDLKEWSAEQAGHDFWLTRNRHGTGFWDRGKGAAGERLTQAAHTYRELTPIIGDDGRIYFE